MKRSTLLLFVAFMVSCAICGTEAARTGQTDAALRAQGKKIFVSHACAHCHDEDGNKNLPDGTTLVQRLSKSADPEARLGTRLKDPAERHAVMMHLDESIKRLESSAKSR